MSQESAAPQLTDDQRKEIFLALELLQDERHLEQR